MRSALQKNLFGEGTTRAKETREVFETVGLNGSAQPPLETECEKESECSAGAAMAAQEPAHGGAATVSMLATLYRARGKLAQASASGRYFMPLYEENMGRITELVSLDPTLQAMTVNGLLQITPALNALAEGEGEKFKLSAYEMAEIEAALKRLAQDDRIYSGGGALSALIERELKWLRLPSYAGMTYAEGFDRLNKTVGRRGESKPPSGTGLIDPNCEKPYSNAFQIDGFNVATPDHTKASEISGIDASGVACGTTVELGGEPDECSVEGTLNQKLTLELPPGDKIHHTSEMTSGSWVGKVIGRVFACAGKESRSVFGTVGLRTVQKPTAEECPEKAVACYEVSGSFEKHEEHGYAWVTEESSRLTLTTGPVEVFDGSKKIPVGFGQFGVELCAMANEAGKETCGTAAAAWVHKNGTESQPGCPTSNGRYVARVTDEAGKTTLPAESCDWWGEDAHKELVDKSNIANAVSCVPETTECAVTDNKGNAYYATNVSATAAATWKSWTGPTSPGEAIACPASTLCALADGKVSEGGGGNMYYSTSFGGSWSEAFKPTHGVLAISCASSSFCVDGQEAGRVSYTTKPGSTSWTEVAIGSGAMNGIFCLSPSFCAAVTGSGDLYVANSEAHIKEATGWKSTDIDGSSALHGVGCTSTTSCVAVDGEGHILDLAINGSGEATATKHDIDGTNELTAITCTTGYTCVAVDNTGNVFVSTSSGQTWNDQHALGAHLTSVSCATLSLCVTADISGDVTAFTPIGVPASNTETIDSGSSLASVSCVPATADCVVADSKGNEQYATNVTARSAMTWHSWSGPTTPSEAVSCPTSTLCVLADGSTEEGSGGDMYYATSLGGTWTEAFSPEYGVVAVSCASASLCVDGQSGGYVRYTTKPGSAEWSSLSIGSGTMNAVDCLSSSFCAIVDSSGHVHVASTAAHIKEAAGWKSTDVDGSTALHGIACTTTTFCIAVDDTGSILELSINSSSEATVIKEAIDGSNNLTAITCTGATCVAVDSQGDILKSSNGGTAWNNVHALGTDLASVACATSMLCVAADTTGKVTAFEPE